MFSQLTPALRLTKPILQQELHENTPTIGVFSCLLSFYTHPHMPNMNDTLVGAVSWSASFLRPPTHTLPHAEHGNHTHQGVISCSVSFLCPPTHAEHERHPRWCRFVVRVFSSSSIGVHTCPTTCQARNHTKQGVISCSASFLRPTTHADHETTCRFVVSVFSLPTTYAEHKTTPSLVLFRAQILSYPLE